jgi:hypothetical protein
MPKQAELLERLRVRWQRPLTASEARWAVCFAHLVAFARRHGHCQVLHVHKALGAGAGRLPLVSSITSSAVKWSDEAQRPLQLSWIV